MLLGRSYRPNKSQPLAYYRARPIAVLWAGSGYAHAQEYTKCGAKSAGVASRTRDRSTCNGGKVVSAGVQTNARPHARGG